MSDEWCTIESDPGVFTCLCEEVGVKGIQFEEIFTLGPEAFMDLGTCHGLIFLFKWRQESREGVGLGQGDPDVFFAQQVIPNACATQAILSVILNSSEVDIGPHLKDFKEFTAGLDSQMRGLAISNSDIIRKAHNSFHRTSSFEIIQDKDSKGDDAFHFVGYIAHKGKLYELDGLKPGPICLGDAGEGSAWLEVARTEIQKRIDSYAGSGAGAGEEKAELRFNLMAIVTDRLTTATKEIEKNRFLRQRANINLISQGEDVELADEVDDDDAPPGVPTFEELSEKDKGELQNIVKQCNADIERLQATVDAENQRRTQWKRQNDRIRHDFVPLALCALKHLAKKQKLVPAFNKGHELALKKAEEKKAAEAPKTG